MKTYTMNEEQLLVLQATANILLAAGDSNSRYLGQKLFNTVQQITAQKVTDQKAATSMALQRYLRIARDASNYPQVPRIVCKDGFSLSVQASSAHYCCPRDNSAPYTEVEVGYPSDVPHGIMQYCEDSDSPTSTVYAFVPIEKVEALITLHGGSDFSARW